MLLLLLLMVPVLVGTVAAVVVEASAVEVEVEVVVRTMMGLLDRATSPTSTFVPIAMATAAATVDILEEEVTTLATPLHPEEEEEEIMT